MLKTIAFTMTPHENKPKHSTRFEFENFDSTQSQGVAFQELEKFKPSFYIPKPFASRAKRIRVTIEEIG